MHRRARPTSLLSVLSPLGALFVCALAGTGCSQTQQNTQIMITVDAQEGVRDASQHLRIRVFGAAQGARQEDLLLVQDFPFDTTATEFQWPTVVAIAPRDRDATRVYRVEASSFSGPNDTTPVVATVRAFSGYVPYQTLWLRLTLQDACIGHECEMFETCDRGNCVDSYVPPEELPPWVVDGGLPTGDGAMDGGADGGDGGARCVTPADCDDGLSCTDDACGAAGCVHLPMHDRCDDGEVCTDDTCGASTGDGCAHTPNSAGCDDGDFCNGFDGCDAGSCSLHPTPTCAAPLVCNETLEQCDGCSTSAPCPSPTFGTPGSCTYASTCATSGTATRSVRSFTCTAGSCVPMDGTDTQSCGARSTAGDTCGTPECVDGTCNYASACALLGSANRTCRTFTCNALGACEEAFGSTLVDCGARGTEGDPCNDFVDCTTDDRCAAGACVGSGTCDAGGFDAGCGDEWACTLDYFVDGGCVHMPSPALCDDGYACSTDECNPGGAGAGSDGCDHQYAGCSDAADTPDAGGAICVTSPSICEDFDGCTVDSCAPGSADSDPSTGCVHFVFCTRDGGRTMPVLDGGN